KLDKTDLQLIIDRIIVYEDRIEIQLKADIDTILKSGQWSVVSGQIEEDAVNFNQGIVDSSQTRIVQSSKKRKDKVYDVHVISSGDGCRTWLPSLLFYQTIRQESTFFRMSA
ncbi:MAG: hypothetical protein FWE80_09325, partial [Oscillospiraceae bacterium]|nr:hypothetical protein [Oscillospiraceae bacterium]